jgi:O-antigen/teichoic acid export membrane protein
LNNPARNVAANVLGWFIPLAAYYLALPVILKAIGAGKFGLIVFAMTLVGYIGVVNPPVSAGSVRFLSAAYGRGDREGFIGYAVSGAVLSVGLAAAAGGILFALAPWIAGRFFAASPELGLEMVAVFRLACLGFIVSALIGAASAIPAAMQQYGVINLCTGGGAALGLALGTWQGMNARSATVVVAGQVAGNVLSLAVLVRSNMRTLGGMGLNPATLRRHWRAGMRELFSFSATLWVSQVCSTVALQTDKFIVGLMNGPVALAWYSIPAKVGEQMASAIGRVSVALYPLAGAHGATGQRDRVITAYGVFLRLSLMASVITVVIARTHGAGILRLWLKADLPANAAAILLIAVLTALFRTPGTVAYHVVNGLGNAGISLLAGAVGAATSATGVLIGAVTAGPLGASLGFLASAVITNVAFDWVVRLRLLHEPAGRWIEPYVRTAFTLAFAVLASGPLVADSAESLPMIALKAVAAVALALVIGYGFGLLRIADVHFLRKPDEENLWQDLTFRSSSLRETTTMEAGFYRDCGHSIAD